MIRDLGPYIPKRPAKLTAPLFEMLLNAVHDRHQGQVFVLQVGAGNGQTALPLLTRFQNDGWSGLLIEPHPQHFADLDTLHANGERVAVLNLGISDVSASLPLFSLSLDAEVRNRRAPRGRASLNRDRIAAVGTTPEDVTSSDVPFLRLDTVLTELGIDSVQLLAINAGGHEEQVLASCNLSSLNPSLVLVHSALDTASDTSCIAILTGADYHPFRVAGWLIGLAPSRLAVPLEELLTFFQKGIGAPQDDEE